MTTALSSLNFTSLTSSPAQDRSIAYTSIIAALAQLEFNAGSQGRRTSAQFVQRAKDHVNQARHDSQAGFPHTAKFMLSEAREYLSLATTFRNFCV